MVFTRFCGLTDSQNHSRTDTPKRNMPPVQEVFRGRGIIIIFVAPKVTAAR